MKKQIKKIYTRKYYGLSDLCNFYNAVAQSTAKSKSGTFDYYFYNDENREEFKERAGENLENLDDMTFIVVESERKLKSFTTEEYKEFAKEYIY